MSKKIDIPSHADPRLILDEERSRHYEDIAATLDEEQRERDDASTDPRSPEEIIVDAVMLYWEDDIPYAVGDPFPPSPEEEQEAWELACL